MLESIVRGRPLCEVLAALCKIVETQAGSRATAAVLLTDDTRAHLTTGAAPSLPDAYNRAIDGIAIARDVGTCCDAAARRAVVITQDIENDPAWAALRHLPLELGLKAAWSMPIISSSGDVLGTFGTYFDEARAPHAHERQLVEVLSRTAALAIERERTDRALRASASHDRFLLELAAATQPLASAAELMDTTARMLAEHLGVQRCAYAEVHDDTTLVVTGNYTNQVPSIVGRWPLAAFGPTCAHALRAGLAFVVQDSDSHAELTDAQRPAYRTTRTRACIFAPLLKQGRLTACLAVQHSEPRVWARHEVDLVSTVTARCWEALERARITRTLSESETRYRAMVEASPDCVKLVAADGTLLQINGAGLAVLEVDATADSSLIGSSIFDAIAPEHRAAFQAFNERVCAGERGTLEFEVIGQRGTRRWMESSAVPLRLANELLAQLAVTRDMSARIAAEQALTHSRARLDYAARLSGVGFWYCDLPFDLLSWDKRVKEHFFLPEDAQVDIDMFYERLHPEDRERTRSAIDRSIEDHAPYDIIYRTQCQDSGAIKWIRALGGTDYDEAGAPRRFDGVTLDVTAQRHDQDRLSQLLAQEQEEGRERAHLVAQLREQEQRKDEFLATLAHELRNPLAPIRIGLEILRSSTKPDLVRKTQDAMERQLVHLVRMVDDLLDASRVTVGKLTLQPERLDFHNVLQSALETTRPLLEAAGHDLHLQLPAHALPIDGDATRLSQVLANLLNNAIKYTPPNGRIQLSADSDGCWLTITISDDGVGIPSEMLEKVFDIFTQVSRSVKHAKGGLGIGLTLVRRLVELHGGSIQAASAGLGRGSTFTLRLPQPQSAPVTEPAQVATREPTPARRGLRVLVVDDNEDAAECLAALLQLDGHDPELAHSGPDAVSCALRQQPDVILLDLGLPGFDGCEVARRVRAELGERAPRMIAITGLGADSDRRRTQEAGFDHHLVKPVSVALLRQALAPDS